MKPYKSFLFVVTVLAVLLFLPLLFPEGTIRIAGIELRVYRLQHISEDLSVPAEGPLRFMRPADKTPREEQQRADTIRDAEIPEKKEMPARKRVPDPAPEEMDLAASELLIPKDLRNEWNEMGFRLLKAREGSKPLRVLYFGDSQIENDRITSAFREIVQQKYGGTGRGLVPVENIYNTANNLIQIPSETWETASVATSGKEPLDLGFLCKAFRVVHTGNREDSLTSSWIRIRSIHEQAETGYSVVSLYYRASGMSQVSLALNDREPVVKEIKSHAIRELRFHLGRTPGSLELRFETNGEITVYGIALESPTGIMVDNIALRGMAVPGWTRIDTSRLKQMASLLDPALVILHYGINVVPNVSSDYGYYKAYLNRELACFSRILPDIPVLLVGVSDMARKTEGLLASYPNLELILTVQKEAALENGCAFWNLYASMGGRGSMIDWVERKSPLGNPDYVHFTSLGAEKVGTLLARQVIKALEQKQRTDPMADVY